MPKKRKGARLGRTQRGLEQKGFANDKEQAQKRDEAAAAATLQALRATTRSQEPEPPVPVPEPETEPRPPKRRRGINESRRRHAIHELYVNLGEPRPSKWTGHGGT
eukprot:7274260-Prymnesium_polylepis.1